MKIKIKRNAECESCGFKTKLRRYADGYHGDEPLSPRFLCPLCAQTPRRQDINPILRHLNYCMNTTLARLSDMESLLALSLGKR